MKKRILAILLAVFCLSFVLVLASCGGNGGNDNKQDCSEGHSFGEWSTVTVESCTDAGLEKRECSVCGEKEERDIPAGHNWREWVTTTEATCEVAGLKTRECRECNETETAEIPAPGHEKEVTTEAKDPTFDTPGTTEGAKCKNCDYVFSVAVEIPAIGNIANKDFVTVTQGTTWHSFETPMQYLFDGNPETAPCAPKGTPYALTFNLGDAYLYEITVVCNGMGKVYDAWNSKDVAEIKYNIKTVGITCYDENGEVVAAQRWEELNENQQSSVKLEDINSDVATVEIYVESVGNNSNGDAYLWDISMVGTRQPTVCEINGHTWSDWEDVDYVDCETAYTQKRVCSVCEKEETKAAEAKGHTWTEWGFDIAGDPFVYEATCSESGYIGRMCTECGAEDTEDQDKLPHSWLAWDVEGDCKNGATRTRECDVCGETEEEVIPEGQHANIVYEGAVAPTKDKDGSTGVKKCLACDTVLDGAKILRIVNIAKNATITTIQSGFWAANDGNAYKLIDGNRETGMYSDPYLAKMTETITLAAGSNVFEVVLVVNGKGSIAQGPAVSDVTNNEYKISFIISNENGDVIFRSQEYTTLDVTEIVVPVELPEGEKAKEITVVHTSDYGTGKYLWEIEIFEQQTLSACDATGHSWSNWETEEPVCSQQGLTDGYRSRRCTACGELQEEILKAEHSFTDWLMTGITCTSGGTKTRECVECGLEESEIVEAGGHLNIELRNDALPTFSADGYTGDYVCTECGEITEQGQVIPMLVNLAATATPSASAWLVNPNFINDGNMNTGVTGYGDAKRDTTHTLTWASAVGIDEFILYFNGDTTDKNLGGNVTNSYPAIYENTNASAGMTVIFYDEDGTETRRETFNTADLTQYTITFDSTTQISKVEIINTHNWNVTLCVNIWEVVAIAK